MLFIFRGNLDSKLKDLHVDANTEEFEVLIESLKEVWDQRDMPYNNPPEFYC